MGDPSERFKAIPPPAGSESDKETRIHLDLGIDFYLWPTLSSLPASILKTVKDNRAALTLKTFRPVSPGTAKDKNGLLKAPGGYSYSGKSFSAPKVIPDDVTDEKQIAILNRLVTEISGEGFTSAVMTGDTAIFTWGSGFAHKYTLEPWVNAAFAMADGPAFKKELLNHGIALEGSTWKIIDTDTEKTVVGEDAMRFLAGKDPAGTNMRQQILTAYATVTEDHGPTAAQAQWDYVVKTYFKEAVKEGVTAMNEWSPIAICYVIHCHMWGKHPTWTQFKEATHGNLAKILRLEVEVTGYYEKQGDHLLVQPTGSGGTCPSGTMLANMGHGCMFGVVTPLEDAPRAGDVVFNMPKGQKGPFVLRGVDLGYDLQKKEHDQINDDIAKHQNYEINAFIKYFKGLGYAKVLKMRNWYSAKENPAFEKWGPRPRVIMDAVLHANEGNGAQWVVDQAGWGKLPPDQVDVIKATVGIT